jgi:uncharacterized coiled-coil DUF342 family protein
MTGGRSRREGSAMSSLGTILVAEDDAAIAALLIEVLADEGYEGHRIIAEEVRQGAEELRQAAEQAHRAAEELHQAGVDARQEAQRNIAEAHALLDELRSATADANQAAQQLATRLARESNTT